MWPRCCAPVCIPAMCVEPVNPTCFHNAGGCGAAGFARFRTRVKSNVRSIEARRSKCRLFLTREGGQLAKFFDYGGKSFQYVINVFSGVVLAEAEAQ